MSFFGKKFRRVRCENVEEFCNTTQCPEHLTMILRVPTSTFAYTKNEDGSINYSMRSGDNVLNKTFRLGVAHETEQKAGTKVNMTYSMDDEDTLNQVITMSDGKIAYFRRKFMKNEAKMIISMEGYEVTAAIYYEAL